MRAPALAVAAALVLAGAGLGGTSSRGQVVFDEFAPRGDQIHLFRERADGSGRVRLTRGPGSYLQPRWSPDGRRIVAVGGPGLVIVSREGRTLRRLRAGGSTDEPRWSPAGTRIAYLVQRCPDPLGHEDPACADLWVIRDDGGGRHRLTASGVDASQGGGSLYSWSPDGRRIAYVRREGLAVVDVASGRTRRLGGATNVIEQYPAWSPDGRSILFAKQRAPGRTSDLAVVAPDGSGLHRLPGTGDAFEPRWSPDGGHIAYLVDVPGGGGGWNVVVARADGSSRTRVGTSSDYQALVWSPDSRQLLFAGPGDTFEIVRADGKGTPARIPGGSDPDWGP